MVPIPRPYRAPISPAMAREDDPVGSLGAEIKSSHLDALSRPMCVFLSCVLIPAASQQRSAIARAFLLGIAPPGAGIALLLA